MAWIWWSRSNSRGIAGVAGLVQCFVLGGTFSVVPQALGKRSNTGMALAACSLRAAFGLAICGVALAHQGANLPVLARRASGRQTAAECADRLLGDQATRGVTTLCLAPRLQAAMAGAAVFRQRPWWPRYNRPVNTSAPEVSGSLLGQLLVAMPAMDDPRFARAVVLLCQHNDDGAMGLVVNRLSEYRLSEIFAQMQISGISAGVADRVVLAGGPVQTDRGFVLHAGTRDWDSTLRITPSLAVSTSRDVLDTIASGQGPERFLLMLGFAGWGPGQLESELADNAWLTVPADDELLFDVPLDMRWHTANTRLGVDPGQLAGYAGHA